MTPQRGGTHRVSLRVGALGPLLAERVGPGVETEAQVVQRDLARYYTLLATGVVELALCPAVADPEAVVQIVSNEDDHGLSLVARMALLDLYERRNIEKGG